MATKKTASGKKIETPKKNVGNSLSDKSTINQLKGKSAPSSKKKVEVLRRSPATTSSKKSVKKTDKKTTSAKNDSSIFKPLSEEKLTKIQSENKNDSIFSPKEDITKKSSPEEKVFSTGNTNNKTSTSPIFNSNNITDEKTEDKSSIKTSVNEKTVKDGDKKIESIDDLLEAINVAKEKREDKESTQRKNNLDVTNKPDVNKIASIDDRLKTTNTAKDVINDKPAISKNDKPAISKEEIKKTESIEGLLKTINTVKERKEDKDKAFYDKKPYNGTKYKSLNNKKNRMLPLLLIVLFLIIGAGIVYFVTRQNNKNPYVVSTLLENRATNETEYIETEENIDNEVDVVENNSIQGTNNVLDDVLDKDESNTDIDITTKEDDVVQEVTEDKAPETEKQESVVEEKIELKDNINEVVANDNIVPVVVTPKGDYEIYTLKWKESIRTVATKKLGDERRWTTIYRLNSDIFKSPDLYFFGDKIKLPKNKKSSNDMTNEELLSLIEDYKFTIASYEREGNRQIDISRLNAIIKLLNEKIK